MGDLVYREAAIIALLEKGQKSRRYKLGEFWELNFDEIREALATVPSAEPERKTGKWERRNTYHGDDTSGFVDPDWRCSECGGQANVNVWSMYDLTDFCPHCGVDMRKEE